MSKSTTTTTTAAIVEEVKKEGRAIASAEERRAELTEAEKKAEADAEKKAAAEKRKTEKAARDAAAVVSRDVKTLDAAIIAARPLSRPVSMRMFPNLNAAEFEGWPAAVEAARSTASEMAAALFEGRAVEKPMRDAVFSAWKRLLTVFKNAAEGRRLLAKKGDDDALVAIVSTISKERAAIAEAEGRPHQKEFRPLGATAWRKAVEILLADRWAERHAMTAAELTAEAEARRERRKAERAAEKAREDEKKKAAAPTVETVKKAAEAEKAAAPTAAKKHAARAEKKAAAKK